MSEDQSVNPAILDLEQEFLNHLTDQDSLGYIVREGFDADYLNVPQNKAIFAFAQYHFSETGKAPHAAVFFNEFPNMVLNFPRTTIQYTVDSLKDRYQRNELQSLTRDLAKTVNDPGAAMQLLRERTVELDRKTVSTKTLWTPDDDEYFINEMQQRIINGQYRGFSTGFIEVDEFCGGTRPGYLTGLAARPKRQKTFVALQAFIAQILQGHTPIFFTLENTEFEIMQRLFCMATTFPWDKMSRGEMMKNDWTFIREQWREFKRDRKFYVSRPPLGDRSVPSLLLQADKVDADSIFISQFKYIEPMKDYYKADYEKWGSIVVDLKLGATRSGSERPVYVETQLNREATSMSEMMDADLSQLGLTDMWGQACDLMFCLYQNRDMRASGLTEFGIMEARNSDKNNWYIHSEFRTKTELSLQ